MKSLSEIKSDFYCSMTDDRRRIGRQFIWVYGILFSISLFMSVINLLTEKAPLMLATVIFSVLCMLNIFLTRSGDAGMRIARLLFSFEIIVLFLFFIVSGIPEGFSVIWICILPSSGMLLFQRRNGTIISAVMFVIIVFFFQTSTGQSLLMYSYTESFMLRFPMLYLAFFALSFFLETVRAITYEKLKDTQRKYEYLYAHDALTGLYNRYGFNARLMEMSEQAHGRAAALMILDIDHFKAVNDRFGHLCGDEVLRQISEFLLSRCSGRADVCRWGGEEFALLYSDGHDAQAQAERLCSSLEKHTIKHRGSELNVTASIGVAVSVSLCAENSAQLLELADKCLLKAKALGRNQVVCEEL